MRRNEIVRTIGRAGAEVHLCPRNKEDVSTKVDRKCVGVAGAVGALFLVFSFLSKVGIKVIGLENGRTWRMQCDCPAA